MSEELLSCFYDLLRYSVLEPIIQFNSHPLYASATDSVQIQEEVQVTTQLPKAIDRRTKRPDSAFWKKCSRNVFEEGAHQETKSDVLIGQFQR